MGDYAEPGWELLRGTPSRASTSYEAYSPTDGRAEIEFNSTRDEIVGLPHPVLLRGSRESQSSDIVIPVMESWEPNDKWAFWSMQERNWRGWICIAKSFRTWNDKILYLILSKTFFLSKRKERKFPFFVIQTIKSCSITGHLLTIIRYGNCSCASHHIKSVDRTQPLTKYLVYGSIQVLLPYPPLGLLSGQCGHWDTSGLIVMVDGQG